MDVLVVGAGPAGVFAALRAADLGTRTVLVTSGDFGGMAANDGPVPVRTLAHAARLLRDAGQLDAYGIAVGRPQLDYCKLLDRTARIVNEVRRHSALRPQLDAAGVTIHEQAGRARFVDAHCMETEFGLRLAADRIILCTGGKSCRLDIPGFELTASHSDAWSLRSVPTSMVVIGGGATGLQVASVFAAFGTHVRLFQAGPRILPSEDEDVAHAVAWAFRQRGIGVEERFGEIERFDSRAGRVKMTYRCARATFDVEAQLIVAAVGWSAVAEALDLGVPGVATDARGFVQVDENGCTSVPHIYAAGDCTGGAMLAPQAMHGGFLAASAALGQPCTDIPRGLVPVGSFTDPEYAHVGLTEALAAERHAIVVAKVPFDDMTRAQIDGRTFGFCKLIAEQGSGRILGCHIVGERAVDIVQLAALAMAGDMTVDRLARFPMSFPTYGGILARAALVATHRMRGDSVKASG